VTQAGSTNDGGAGNPAPSAPPFAVVVVALAFGTLLVGGVTLGGYLSTLPLSDHVANGTAAASPRTPELPQPRDSMPRQGATAVDWQLLLQSSSCSSPCAGGVACTDKPTECKSGFTCVPGPGGVVLGPSESWMLHLSAVVEADGLDPCTKREYSVCRIGTADCVSQRAACGRAGGAMSPTGIALTAGELFSPSGLLEVREGDPTGPVLATTQPFPRYARGALCRGFAVGADGDRVRKVTFFLLPP
jgi:hypothetical protein